MISSATVKHRNLRSEIVIVGGGGAGLAAAVSAKEKGADVILLEKREVLGGNSALATGLFAAESPVQRRLMIDARRDDLFKMAMNFAHWRIEPRIVRAFIDKSGDTIRWLEERGVGVDQIRPQYPNQVPGVWHVVEGWGARLIKVLAKTYKDLGGKILSGSAGKKILTGPKGDVKGVLGITKGREFKITANSAIIATGGYGGNKHLLKRYCPDYHENMYLEGLPTMGDGLLMATEIGAATEGLGILQLFGPVFPKSRLLWAVAREPSTLWVNRKGKRFADESVTFYMGEAGNVIYRQPDKLSYTLFDAKTKQLMIEQGMIKGLGPHYTPQKSKLLELEKELQQEADKGEVGISNSWEKIAEWIGADSGDLKATIGEYNAASEQGHDPIFAKDRRYLLPLRTPPYYAIRTRAGFHGTIGGIKINEHMQVIDIQDKPIPGLYAAGIDTGGWESETYCVVLAGSTFGFALNSGRIAGENAVQFVRGNDPKKIT
jgi:fumarate reductase flavoprotein subunit